MLILLTIFAALLAISILVFAKRRSTQLLEEKPPQHELSASEFRPLFEPGPEELRAATREEQEAEAAADLEKEKQSREQKHAEFKEFRKAWRAVPSRKNTVELLYLASQGESGNIYAETANEVIKTWKNGQIEDLSADDLSQLLESHFWLLPAGERTTGVKFSLLEEIAGLRREIQEDNKPTQN